MRLEVHVHKALVAALPHGHHADGRIASHLAAMEPVVIRYHDLLHAVNLRDIRKLGARHATLAANDERCLVKELVDSTAQVSLQNRIALAQAERLRLRHVEEALQAELAPIRIFHLARHVVIGMFAAELRKVELRGGHHVETPGKVRVARENLVRLFLGPVDLSLLLEGHDTDRDGLENRNANIHRDSVDRCKACYRSNKKEQEYQA